MTLVKIISGGQTGADQAGLFAAEALGLKTGGLMPKGFRTEYGPMPDIAKRFNLGETSSSSYYVRTHMNVQFSDATLTFGNVFSRGTILTRNYAAQEGKPCYCVEWPPKGLIKELYSFIDWLIIHKVKVLNVAGNRESKNPGIFVAAKAFLILNLKELSP